ncbi:uncharacterized protein BDZ99DRAFT_573923 [Mytilinidion resinicola]|uniref:BAH domain-containing protein n=1 Tax=Mytilinidion resinicola TaxID=574789 RepID=A0A6A6YEX1_9PEZI|nr:uncharacterized protein BDZ99DRAFT_573923 [Mytilinidion resinicola]KAF2806407.1 hypothetical protein BDZ99DRAFT_573923 [Mytilinidion resinicola]
MISLFQRVTRHIRNFSHRASSHRTLGGIIGAARLDNLIHKRDGFLHGHQSERDQISTHGLREVEVQHATKSDFSCSRRRAQQNRQAEPLKSGQPKSIRPARDRKKRVDCLPLTHGGQEVRPGDYIIVACDKDETNERDLPEIARVEKLRPNGHLDITWMYYPSILDLREPVKSAPNEILFSDHKDTISGAVLMGFTEVEENC